MQHDRLETATRPTTPGPPVHVLIEDPGVTSMAPDLEVPPGFSVTMCSGPLTASEPCPLVLDGACPHGTPDVVVCSLDGPWARSVQAAWTDTGVPVVDGVRDGTAQQRLDHAIGAAISVFVALADCEG